ncbi:hypothetical protein ABIF65_002868 [Bradyrhizobium japonicum]
MKMFPTPWMVPSSSLKVWLTIAPPLEASAPAPGKDPRGGAAGEGVESDGGLAEASDAALPRSK